MCKLLGVHTGVGVRKRQIAMVGDDVWFYILLPGSLRPLWNLWWSQPECVLWSPEIPQQSFLCRHILTWSEQRPADGGACLLWVVFYSTKAPLLHSPLLSFDIAASSVGPPVTCRCLLNSRSPRIDLLHRLPISQWAAVIGGGGRGHQSSVPRQHGFKRDPVKLLGSRIRRLPSPLRETNLLNWSRDKMSALCGCQTSLLPRYLLLFRVPWMINTRVNSSYERLPSCRSVAITLGGQIIQRPIEWFVIPSHSTASAKEPHKQHSATKPTWAL